MTLAQIIENFLEASVGWPAEAHGPTALAIAGIGVTALALFGLVHAPLTIRLMRLSLLRRRIDAIRAAGDEASPEHRSQLAEALERSPIASEAQRFVERWDESKITPPVEGEVTRAPVHFSDILAEQPLLPAGARRSLLAMTPWILTAAGVAGSLSVLSRAGVDWGATLPIALQASLFGLLLAVAAAAYAGWLVGRFDVSARGLDLRLESFLPFASAHWLARRETETERERSLRLREELAGSIQSLAATIEAGQKRIEQSSVKAASLIADEQRNALTGLLADLRSGVEEGVEEHLLALHEMLRTTAAQQESVASGLALNFERMAESTESHHHSTRALENAGRLVHGAAEAISETTSGFEPVLSELSGMINALATSMLSLQENQGLAQQGLTAVRDAAVEGNRSLSEQRALLERGLDLLNTAMDRAGSEFTPALTAALGRVDTTLSRFSDRLDALARSVEGVDPNRRRPSPPAPRTRAEPAHDSASPEAESPSKPKPGEWSTITETRYADLYRGRSLSRFPRESTPMPRSSTAAPSGGAPSGGLSGLLRSTPARPAAEDTPPSETSTKDD